MNKIIYKVSAGITTAALLATAFAPAAFADTTVEISGNGSNSSNTGDVTQTSTVAVSQSNVSDVDLTVKAKANTGGNEASGNTGDGGVSITTGNATADAGAEVTGSKNIAKLPCDCICPNGETGILISGNGNHSTNNSTVVKTNSLSVGQTNNQKVKAKVKAKAKSGKNKANNNTGGGGVSVTTGDASSISGGNVSGPKNVLKSDCGCNDQTPPQTEG